MCCVFKADLKDRCVNRRGFMALNWIRGKSKWNDFFRIKLINCGLKQKPSTGIHFRVKKRKCVRSSEWKEWDSSYNRHYLRVCGLMSAHAQRCCCTSWGAAVFGVGSSVRHGRDAGHERATLPRQPQSVERLLWEEIYLCVCVWGCVQDKCEIHCVHL